MPALGVNATWGEQDFASYVLQHLQAESVLLRAGARVVPVTGRTFSIPRVLTDGTATWTAEGAEITSSAPTGDLLTLTPKKLANVLALSVESVADAPVDELDAVGTALTQSIATAVDVAAFSATAATATTPAGLRSYAIPAQTGGVNIDNVIRAVGTVQTVGAVPSAVFMHPTDVTTLRLVKEVTGSNRPVLAPDLQGGGAERIAGAVIWPTPNVPVGTALVMDPRQVVVGIRSDIDVTFSADAKFTADSIAAKVTARLDWGWNDIRGAVAIGA